MIYSLLEEYVGDLVLERGSTVANWVRYPEALRRKAISEAERIAAIHLPPERKQALIAVRTGLTVASDVISVASIGPRVMQIERLYAAYNGIDTDFKEIKSLADGWLRANLNLRYGFTWQRTDAGGLKIQSPPDFDPATYKPAMVVTNYPLSYDLDGCYLYFTANPTVAFAVGDTIKNAGATATGTVLAVGPDWLKYTPVLTVFAVGDVIDTAAVEVPEHGPATVKDVIIAPDCPATYPAATLAAWGSYSCPFTGDEEIIAAGAASILLTPEGKPMAQIYAQKFFGEMGMLPKQEGK